MSKSSKRRSASPPPKRFSIQLIGGLGFGAVILFLIGYWLFTSTPKDLLDSDDLSDSQIRKIATWLLVHEDIDMRVRAAAKLGELDQKAVPVMKDVCLTHDDPKVRSAVFDQLMVTDKDAGAEVLQTLIDDPDAQVRMMAAQAASHLSHPTSAEVLKKALGDDDPSVLLAGIEGSQLRGLRSAVPQIKAALDSDNLTVRRHAARALLALTGKSYQHRVNPPRPSSG
jgi:HEAT repeat protein